MYASAWVDMFIDQACKTEGENDICAEATLKCIFKDNERLLDEVITPEIVQKFEHLMTKEVGWACRVPHTEYRTHASPPHSIVLPRLFARLCVPVQAKDNQTVDLLASFCTCRGDGVVSNQNDITDMLFRGPSRDTLVYELRVERSIVEVLMTDESGGAEPRQWVALDLFLASCAPNVFRCVSYPETGVPRFF
jgi:hypothetical protein